MNHANAGRSRPAARLAWTLAVPWVAAMVLLSASALAQEDTIHADTPGTWGIIWDGLEWPAYIILAGSVALLTLIVEHFISIRRATVVPAEQVRLARRLIERRQFRECHEKLRTSRTFFAQVLTTALRHGRHGFDAMHEAALERSSQLAGQMFRKVEYMSIIGNLGPLMGLLGTVLGMILAFGELGAGGGQAGSDAGQLARGISLALVNTLLGLAVAIVGLGFFGICRNRVDALTVQATVEVLDLLEYFRPLPAEPSRTAGAAPPRPAPPVATPPVQPAPRTS